MSLFITFEGIEGVGKTTQVKKVKGFLDTQNIASLVVREPGGTSIGNRIREILLDPQANEMHVKTEILLYAASRAQLIEEKIVPALKNGMVVICDRFVDSTIAYQSYGGGWDRDEIIMINRMAASQLVPDRTYLLDLTIAKGVQRLDHRGMPKDRMEQKETTFHQRVKKGFLELADEHPDRIKKIEADQNREEVFQDIIEDLIPQLELIVGNINFLK